MNPHPIVLVRGVDGCVLDKETGKPIENVRVMRGGDLEETRSDKEGMFHLAQHRKIAPFTTDDDADKPRLLLGFAAPGYGGLVAQFHPEMPQEDAHWEHGIGAEKGIFVVRLIPCSLRNPPAPAWGAPFDLRLRFPATSPVTRPATQP
jgi:hypothetical protein